MTADVNSELLARLKQLALHTPQAEIARKTETSRNNVSRYLKGTKMPLEFGVGLVKGLGINPSWLLAGEGSPRLSDIAAGTEKTAADLLSLVNAMAEVARMRLGALAGKHHLKVLRELNDALADFTLLRARLNEQTVPIFNDLNAQYEQALERREASRADELRKALSQVSRLCDDAELSLQFTHLQTLHEQRFGDRDKALEYAREVFRQSLAQKGEPREFVANDAYNLALMLRALGRLEEARGVCNASLAIWRAKLRQWSVLRAFSIMRGALDIELGNLRRGLPRVLRAYSYLPAQDRQRVAASLLRALWMSGAAGFAELDGIGAPGDTKARAMLFIAAMGGSPAELRLACERYIGSGDARVAAELPIAQLALTARRALSGKAREEIDRYQALIEPEIAAGGVRTAGAQIQLTHLRRLAGEDAKQDLQASQRALAAMPQECTLDILLRAAHARNVLSLAPKIPAAKAAKKFFLRHKKRGYTCFATWQITADASV